MKNLKNKIIVITGGAEGIGKSLVLLLLKTGAEIVVYDRSTIDYLESLEINERLRITCFKGDITKKKDVEAFVAYVHEEFGKIDILINNAGASIARNSAAETPDELSEFIFNVNYWGAVYFIKSFLPLLRSFGESKIVNICSIFSLFSVCERAAYCASKSALKAYSDALRLELRPRKIDVLCVFPGKVNTNIALNSIGWANKADKLMAIKLQNGGSALSPQCAAKQILKGIKKSKNHIFVGADAKVARFLLRLFPYKGVLFINWLIKRSEKNAKQKVFSPVSKRPPSKKLLQFEFTK